jgi:hypothetical protein
VEFPFILRTEVPYNTAFEQVAVRRAPVEVFAPHGPAAEIYRSLWREIDERLALADEPKVAQQGT